MSSFDRMKKLANEKFTEYQKSNPNVYKEENRIMFCLAYMDGYVQKDVEMLNQLKKK